MALELLKTLDNGVTAGYWKIINCDIVTGTTIVGLFTDAIHAKDGGNVLCRRAYLIDFISMVGMNSLTYAYDYLKATDYFTRAEDR